MAHTNGPWKAEHYLVVADRVTRSRRFAIADTFTLAALSDSEKEANAKLIAAAPEMLNALKDLLDWHENPETPDNCWMEARYIIAKAEGREL